MPEDAGKKSDIRDFLNRVSNGLGFIEDIWIEREIREPGGNDTYCLAKSLSGRMVSNFTELLEDDLRYCFEDNFFAFRFVSAFPGSGKTSLLKYLHELIKLKKNYESRYLTSFLSINDILSMGGQNSFNVKLYSHILGETFWSLLSIQNTRIQVARDKLLKTIFSDSEVGELRSAIDRDREDFNIHWNRLILTKSLNFESFFFDVVKKITSADPQFSFVYLIDEIDGLKDNALSAGEARSFFRSLINKSHEKYDGKLRLMVYLVGVSEDVKSFLEVDAALKSRIIKTRIDLVVGRKEEFEKIRSIISGRFHSAYKGCKDFPQAWQEINQIELNIGIDYSSLRDFCQKYAGKVSEIHEKYFTTFDASYNLYENKARQLVEAEARKQWSQFLNHNAYDLSISNTTSSIGGHAFDCYLELRHNGSCVARAFGEAKNYQLLSSHLTTLDKWLQDVKFNREANPPELAFLIAPSCADLLLRKIDFKNILFLQSDKVEDTIKSKVVYPESEDSKKDPEPDRQGIDINSAMKKDLMRVFKGKGIGNATIDKIINKRAISKFYGLEDLSTQIKLTNPVKVKLREMQDKKEICFSS